MFWLSRVDFPEGYEHHLKRRALDKSIFIGALLLAIGSLSLQATLGGGPARRPPKEVSVLELQWVEVVEVHENRVSSGEGTTYPVGATDVESELRRNGYEIIPVGVESVIPQLSMRCDMQLQEGGGMVSVPCAGLGESIYFASEGKVWEQRPVFETWYHWTLTEDVVVETYSSDGINSVPVSPELPPLAENQFAVAQQSQVLLQVAPEGEEPHWVTLDDPSLVESILSRGMVRKWNTRGVQQPLRDLLTALDGGMPDEGIGTVPTSGH